MIGYSYTGSGDIHGFLWDSGTMTDLGSLGGPRAEALALNDNGVVVGYSLTSDYKQRAVLWSKPSSVSGMAGASAVQAAHQEMYLPLVQQ